MKEHTDHRMIDGKKAKPEEHVACPVAGGDVSFCGSSCKYFSAMNNNFNAGTRREFFGNARWRKKTIGGSPVSGRVSVVDAFLEEHKPLTAMWENVEISSQDDKNDAQVSKKDAANGWVNKSILESNIRHFSP